MADPPKAKFDTLWYLHVPKCGTSFIIAMRNYLDACEVKGFSCPGNVEATVADGAHGGKGALKAVNILETVSDEEMTRTQTCGGALWGCQKDHASWPSNAKDLNVVTVIRDPLSRLLSQWKYFRKHKNVKESMVKFDALVRSCIHMFARNETSRGCEWWASDMGHPTVMTRMLAGRFYIRSPPLQPDEMETVERRLLEETAFYGITDLYEETICVFHCELGTKMGPGELLNTRDNGRVKKDAGELLSLETRRHLERIQADEIRIYNKARKRFEERAKKCGCM